ncbi:peptidoglycan DD-metalloendopeptidase family protein [Cyanothece sp. BG0011]|uniref:peptidoglycan DD-metalloendopeptidase family protein n=1 Tax=Cyanothece sp. BG0011 TaxID=2082950 RepID=UPI000D1EF25B
MSSCLADYTQAKGSSSPEDSPNKLPSSEKNRVRRSAAMISLAISMGATGMLLSQDKAMAANAVTANTAIPSLPNLSEAQSRDSQLAPLALKHKVEAGETLAQLAQDYQVRPEAIAAINNLTLTAQLQPGETIKIPSSKDSVNKITPKSSTDSKPQNKGVGTKSVNTSLDHLRETRQRLQDSLAELKTEEAKVSAEAKAIADVSQPLNQPSEQPTIAEVEKVEVAQAIEIPVYSSESEQESVAVKEEEKEKFASLRGSILDNNEQSDIPIVPSLQPQTTAKIESDQPIPLNVIPAQEDSQPSQRPQPIDVTTPEQTSFIPPRKPTVPKPTIKATEKSYRVRPGDTLNSIARRHGISTHELIRANGITNANLIRVNQTLMIPQENTIAQAQPSQRSTLPSVFDEFRSNNQSSRSLLSSREGQSAEIQISVAQQSHTDKLKADIVTLQRDYGQGESEISLDQPRSQSSRKTVVGEALNSEWKSDRQEITSPQQAIEQRLNNRQPELISAAPSNPTTYNNAFEIPVGTSVGPDLPGVSNPDDYLPDAPMRFTGHIWPSKGVITSGFGPRWGRMHKGIDIAAPVGTPIMASAPGEVITAGWNSGGFGNLVKVRHPDGSVTLYAHNSRILVRRGQKVEQGQQIAEMGSTGYSTGPHLHYEIHPKGSGAKNPMAFLPKNR